MSKLKVYITRHFLESYIACRLKPFASFNANEEKIIPFIGDVLNTGDCYMDFDFSSKIQDKNDNTNLTKYLRTLSQMKGGLKRESCLPYLEKIKNQNSIEPHEHPNYLLFSEKDNLEIDLGSKNLGFIPIIDTFKLHKRINEVCIKNIEPREKLIFNRLSQYHYNAHCVIIEDPYIFSNDDYNGAFINDFLKYLLTEKTKKFITIIYTSENETNKKVCEIVELTKGRFKKTNHVVEFIDLPKRNLHDRNVYCDTNWLTCGIGFQREYPKSTEIVFKPIAKYYQQFNKKILSLNATIKKQKPEVTIQNPFLNKFKTP